MTPPKVAVPDVAVPGLDVKAVAKSVDQTLLAAVVTDLQEGGVSPETVANALALQPAPAQVAPPATRNGLLYALVSSPKEAAARVALLGRVLANLRAELPAALAASPLRPVHFGLSTADELVELVGARLKKMETGAASLQEFEAGLEGWRQNIVGTVLFERLVKYHPQLDAFTRSLAGDFFGVVNDELAVSAKTLIGVDGTPRTVTAPFGPPEKSVNFTLTDAGGVTRSFTDFGFLATNPENYWGFLPAEIKLPAALAGVSGQFAEFMDRLATAKQMYATLVVGDVEVRRPIDPSRLVFLQHQLSQVAVAPVSAKRLQQHYALGPIGPESIASVDEFRPVVSRKYGSSHYLVRLLVDRAWLADLVRPLTDP